MKPDCSCEIVEKIWTHLKPHSKFTHFCIMKRLFNLVSDKDY
jgi:hypothetical protein